MSNKVYDILKVIALQVFPPVATCVITILTVLNYPNVTVVAGILTAIETCLGAILGVSSAKYYKKIADEVYNIEEFENIDLDEIDDGK